MADVFHIIGEALLILALVGLIGVLVWLVMTVLRAKTVAMTNAGRLYKRPLNATKNLIAAGKGIVQQETVRVKHIGASVKDATGAVKEAAREIKTAAESVHPEELRPALSTTQNVFQVLRLAAKLSHSAAIQGRPTNPDRVYFFPVAASNALIMSGI